MPLQPQQRSNPPEMTIDPNLTYLATMHTDQGDITAKLYAEKAPRTVNNFV